MPRSNGTSCSSGWTASALDAVWGCQAMTCREPSTSVSQAGWSVRCSVSSARSESKTHLLLRLHSSPAWSLHSSAVAARRRWRFRLVMAFLPCSPSDLGASQRCWLAWKHLPTHRSRPHHSWSRLLRPSHPSLCRHPGPRYPGTSRVLLPSANATARSGRRGHMPGTMWLALRRPRVTSPQARSHLRVHCTLRAAGRCASAWLVSHCRRR